MAADERTEQPTARRLQEARRKGQVARSRNLGEAAGLAAGLLVLGLWGRTLVEGLGGEVARGFGRVGFGPGHDVTATEVAGLAVAGAWALAWLVGPVALGAAAAVVSLQAAQGGWVVSTEPLKLRFTRLNPVNGFKQFGLSRGGVQTLKAVFIVAALAYLAYGVVVALLVDSQQLALLSPPRAAMRGWDSIRRLLWQCVLAFGVLGAVDYFIQKRQHLKSLKMTKQEVRDDHKLSEGSPEVKGRIRRLMLEAARRRMMAAVPKATVVITNPTHFAVAIEYRRSAMAAPVVVAKGQGLVAQKIKALAREHGVPTVENVPLAQALYKGVEIGEAIPAALFEAVAEVLAYLVRLKQIVL